MATDPRVQGPILKTPLMHKAAMDTATAKMMEQMQAENEQRKKRQMYDHLLDAFKYPGMGGNYASPMVAEEQTLGTVIRSKIEEHKRMIAALEWFASHISLDDPGDNSLIGRVVLEGLRSLSEKHIR